MSGFYGGQPGKSFEIKKKFANKAALVADVSDTSSPVEIGDFVVINYGIYGSVEFQNNKAADGATSYDSTIWQKVINFDGKYDSDSTLAVSGSVVNYIQINTGNGYIPSFAATSHTLSSDNPSTVEVSLEEQTLNFSFGIPQGEQGPQGIQGPQGATEYVVEITKSANGRYSANKTFAEVVAAHTGNQSVFCSFTDVAQEAVRLPLTKVSSESLTFEGIVEYSQNVLSYVRVSYTSNSLSSFTAEMATRASVEAMIGDAPAALSAMDAVIGGAAV